MSKWVSTLSCPSGKGNDQVTSSQIPCTWHVCWWQVWGDNCSGYVLIYSREKVRTWVVQTFGKTFQAEGTVFQTKGSRNTNQEHSVFWVHFGSIKEIVPMWDGKAESVTPPVTQALQARQKFSFHPGRGGRFWAREGLDLCYMQPPGFWLATRLYTPASVGMLLQLEGLCARHSSNTNQVQMRGLEAVSLWVCCEGTLPFCAGQCLPRAATWAGDFCLQKLMWARISKVCKAFRGKLRQPYAPACFLLWTFLKTLNVKLCLYHQVPHFFTPDLEPLAGLFRFEGHQRSAIWTKDMISFFSYQIGKALKRMLTASVGVGVWKQHPYTVNGSLN
jgi:hypothetical protein